MIRGGRAALRANRPIIMIEISLNFRDVETELRGLGYVLLTPEGKLSIGDRGNTEYFALHTGKHGTLLRGLGLPGEASPSAG